MGILLILLILSVGGMFLAVKGEYEWWGTAAGIVGTFAIIFFLIIGGCTIVENACAEKTYTDYVEKRESIEYRLEQMNEDTNLLVNGGTYEDLLDYNKTIRSYKTWSDSFWTGWFYADKIATLDYIELPKSVS